MLQSCVIIFLCSFERPLKDVDARLAELFWFHVLPNMWEKCYGNTATFLQSKC